MLPVGVNPNTQIMGSNCEGSERAKLLCRLLGSGAAGYRKREREGERRERVAPRHASIPPSLPVPLLPYFPFSPSIRGGGERGRREDRNRVIGTKSRGTFSDTHRIDGYAASRPCARPIRARFTSDERYRGKEERERGKGGRANLYRRRAP